MGQEEQSPRASARGVVTLLMLGFASLGLAGLSHSSVGRSLRQAARERAEITQRACDTTLSFLYKPSQTKALQPP